MPYSVFVFILPCSVHIAVQSAVLQHPGLPGRGGTIYNELGHPTSIILLCLGIFPLPGLLLMYYYFWFCVFMDYICVYPCVCVFLQFSLLFVSKEKETEGHGVL